jgi:hypothetical protein
MYVHSQLQNSIGVAQGFLECGMRNAAGTPTIASWYAALRKNWNIKKDKNLKTKWNMSHKIVNMQQSWHSMSLPRSHF